MASVKKKTVNEPRATLRGASRLIFVGRRYFSVSENDIRAKITLIMNERETNSISNLPRKQDDCSIESIQ